ncbi:hypothetical protein KCU83_g25, partial [Aureobasidium melanogenum]
LRWPVVSEPLRVLFQGFYHDDHCDALEWLCSSATLTPLLWLECGEAGQLRMVAVLAYWIIAHGTTSMAFVRFSLLTINH